jgi:hypothetical protein
MLKRIGLKLSVHLKYFFNKFPNFKGGFMYKIFFPILISTLILGTNSFPQTFGIGGGFSIVTGPDTYTKSYNHGGVGIYQRVSYRG